MAAQPIKVAYITVRELLKLTGQQHDDNFKYDKVLSLKLTAEAEVRRDSPGALLSMMYIGAVGVNEEERRVVDIAVHPLFRRLGIGKLLVQLSKCEVAFTVDKEADKFWEHIGWLPAGKTVDKGTVVNVWRHPKGDFWRTYISSEDGAELDEEEAEMTDKSLEEEDEE
jgi:GNAT superfamily N-acetyltransferase